MSLSLVLETTTTIPTTKASNGSKERKQSANQSHESNGEKREGSLAHNDRWYLFDQILFSPAWEAEEVGATTSNSYFSPSLFVHQTRALPRLSLPYKSKRRPFGRLFRSFPGLCNYWSCYSNTLIQTPRARLPIAEKILNTRQTYIQKL